jgi:hypothetical protein
MNEQTEDQLDRLTWVGWLLIAVHGGVFAVLDSADPPHHAALSAWGIGARCLSVPAPRPTRGQHAGVRVPYSPCDQDLSLPGRWRVREPNLGTRERSCAAVPRLQRPRPNLATYEVYSGTRCGFRVRQCWPGNNFRSPRSRSLAFGRLQLLTALDPTGRPEKGSTVSPRQSPRLPLAGTPLDRSSSKTCRVDCSRIAHARVLIAGRSRPRQ